MLVDVAASNRLREKPTVFMLCFQLELRMNKLIQETSGFSGSEETHKMYHFCFIPK